MDWIRSEGQLMNSMRVRDIMTTKVFTLQQDRKVMIADDIMDWAEVRHVPVVDENERVVGVVSRTDLLRASPCDSGLPEERFDLKRHLSSLVISDIMRTPVCIDPDASVQAAAHLMRAKKLNCLPVVDSRNKILGILTSHDILALLEQVDMQSLRLDTEPAPR